MPKPKFHKIENRTFCEECGRQAIQYTGLLALEWYCEYCEGPLDGKKPEPSKALVWDEDELKTDPLWYKDIIATD